MKRRKLLGSIGTLGLSVFSGCSGDDSPDTTTTAPRTTTESPTTETTTEKPTTTVEKIDPIDTERLVGTHYYPWYDDGGHNWTNHTVSDPVLGEYDGTSPEVVHQHLKWSLEHGIRWWSISWWGPDSMTDRNLKQGLSSVEGFDVIDFSILYETVGRFEEYDFDLSDEEAKERLIDDLAYLEQEYFSRENYLHVNGHPLIYFYISDALHGEVENAFEQAREKLETDPYILASIKHGSDPKAAHITAVADGVTSYNPYTPRSDIEDIFHDTYEKEIATMNYAAGNANLDFFPVIIPGYNDTGLPEEQRQDNPILSASPDRFERVCDQARPHFEAAEGVLITSFNEWYENTQIEPSKEYGSDYLEITANKIATGAVSSADRTETNLRLKFNKTLTPSNSADDRELAFMAKRLLIEDGAETVKEYNIGSPGDEPLLVTGYYLPESNNGQSWRWFGGPSAEVVIYFTEDLQDADSGRLIGRPIELGEISADVFFDEMKTDHIEFTEQNGDVGYEFSLVN